MTAYTRALQDRANRIRTTVVRKAAPEAASSQQGLTASNTHYMVDSIGVPGSSQGKEPVDQPAKVPGTDVVAEVDRATEDFTDQDLTQDSEEVENR
ncbi:hypothetical protein HBI70_236900 [Parastagonospora nodorum]|nr:hypothetical protein HBH51_228430 [Parastagonospora nodorum]KAH3959912.1 hypothetical protein HBH52_241040 [Parastagonospora nodorum]KAH4056772.1 hypothetical protein HBH50_240120 [Parastagonospora nodorum]KAH4077817.1 hypothetical protein HBH48_237780 [Parastagonospora nodorum]KAH4215774.1 hypothetical protein HBI06_240950 [Parastagonospora nodorum]